MPGAKPGHFESGAAAGQELRISGCCWQLQTSFISRCQNQQTSAFRLKATLIVIYFATITPSPPALRYVRAGLSRGHLQSQPLHLCTPQTKSTGGPGTAALPACPKTCSRAGRRGRRATCALMGHETCSACCGLLM